MPLFAQETKWSYFHHFTSMSLCYATISVKRIRLFSFYTDFKISQWTLYVCMLFKQPVVSPLCVWVVPLCLPLNMQLKPSERILEKIHTLLWVRQIFFGIHVYLLVSDLYLMIVWFISITLKTPVYSNLCIIFNI